MQEMVDSASLTAAQAGIWLGHQLSDTPAIYNCAEEVTVDGSFSREQFEQALLDVSRAAPSLHVSFIEEAGRPLWRRVPFELRYHYHDLSHEWDPLQAMREQVTLLLQEPLQIERGQLCEHRLFRINETRHVWVFVAHHIALDGYGFQLVEAAVARRYSTGRLTTFDDLEPVSAADAEYQRSSQSRMDAEYWAYGPHSSARGVTLSGRDAKSMGEPSKPAAPVRCAAPVPPLVHDELRLTARRLGAQVPDVLLALVAGFVHVRSGLRRFALGMPTMLRLNTPALRVPCMAMNILPLPLHVEQKGTLESLARQVAARLGAQSPYKRHRYENLATDAFGPLVNILPFRPPLRFGDASTRVRTLAAGPAVGLSLSFAAQGGDMGLAAEGHPDLFDAASLEQIHAEFLAFAQKTLAAPSSPLKISEEPAGDVIDRFIAHVDARPDATALVHEEASGAITELSYRQLSGWAAKFGRRLQCAGATPGCLVAFDLPRGLPATCVIVASLGIGCGYLALDPSHPRERRRQILEQALPAVVVTSQPDEYTTDALPSLASAAETVATTPPARPPRTWLGLKDVIECLPEGNATDLLAGVEADARDPAYVVFTSGSTGQPKGVVVSRGALSHYVEAAREHYAISSRDRALQFASLAFDASVEELIVSLSAGATVVIRSESMLESMAGFGEALEKHRITLLNLPTAFWHELAWAVGHDKARIPGSVRTTIIGGEAAYPTRVEQWLTAVPHARLLNTYGPSEATVVATVSELTRQDEYGDSVAIGKPLAGVGVHVLDEQGLPVRGVNVSGELLISGPTLAEGYLGRPDLTAQRFVRGPDGARAYRTGDLVSFNACGELVFLGRVDSEIKLSGYRIAPEEVERCLHQHPQVKACVVSAVRQADVQCLAAHVEVQGSVDSHALKGFLSARLPPPMVPTLWHLHDKLPRTTSGKIDRPALSNAVRLEAEAHRSERGSAEEEPAVSIPSTAVDEAALSVLKVFQDVLGNLEVNANDDFFVVGGNSLQVITVANRLSALAPHITVASIFQNPTARLLAQYLSGQDVLQAEEQLGTKGRGRGAGDASDQPLRVRCDYRQIEPLSLEVKVKPTPTAVERILLTGATGFVGAHLLNSLIRASGATIYCVVRASDATDARMRLVNAFDRYGLLKTDLSTRIVPVPMDLAQAAFTQLAARLDPCEVVIHAAAQVSLTRNFASMYDINVAATRGLLQFAATNDAAFHYVSTLAVLPRAGRDAISTERIYLEHEALRDGYQQSKWHAEQLCARASQAGLTTTVHRLGRVTGSRSRPWVNPQDILWRVARASTNVQAWPELDFKETWSPVDEVADTMSALIVREQCKQRGIAPDVFHLAHHEPVHVSQLAEALRRLGYVLPVVAVPEWMHRVRVGGDDVDHATLAIFDLMQPAAKEMGVISCERLYSALPNVSHPPIGDDLIQTYCRVAMEAGVFKVYG